MDSTYDKRPQSHSLGVGVRGRNITHVTRLYNVTSETNYVIIYTCAQYVHTYNDLEMKKRVHNSEKKHYTALVLQVQEERAYQYMQA
jgi:hypothetical protein